MARNVRRLLTISAAVLALGPALAACTPPNEVDSEVKVTTASEGAAPTRTSSTTAAATTTSSTASSTAAASDAVQVSKTEEVAEGDELTINISGLDPAVGYYAAICGANSHAPQPPSCTGTMTDSATAAWIKADNTGTTMLNSDGTATATITATATGENVDCRTDECVVKVFGDHSNGFANYGEVPVTFAAQ
jgi:hypothetical protein